MDRIRDKTPSRRSLAQRRTATISKSYAQSPSASPPTPKLKKEKVPAKRKRKKQTGKLYPTNYQAILAETTDEGQVKYLVNWADDPDTGEVYAPTWEPREFVVEAGRLQWEQQKREGLVVDLGGKLVLKEPEGVDTESQSRPAKRRRASNTDQSASQENEPFEKPRRAETPERDRFQPASQEGAEAEGKEPEVKDTYEEDTQESLTESAQIRVELSVPVDFDRSIYRVATVNSSQSSLDPSQQDSTPQDSVEDLSQLEIRASRFIPRRSPFLVPDSKDKVDSDSYDPSTQSRPNTGRATQGDTESGPDSSSIEYESSQLVPSSKPENIDSEAEESLGDLVGFTYRHPTASSVSEINNTELVVSSNSAERSRDQTLDQVAEVLTQPISESSLQIVHDLISSEQSSQLLTPTRERSSPTEKERGASWSLLQPAQYSLQESQADSQLPSPGEEAASIGLPDSNKSQSPSIRQPVVNTSVVLQSEPQIADFPSQNPQPSDLKSQEEVATTQRSWSENPWNTTDVASSAPRYHSIPVERIALSQPVNQVQSFVQFSAPSQINSTAGQSTGSHFPNESPPATPPVQYTPEPLENILQSIEDFEELVSEARFSQPSLTPESPFRQVVSTYDSSKSFTSSSNMEDLALEKAARRAARKKVLEQKFKDDVNRGEASHRASSSIPPSPLVKPTSQQSEPLHHVTKDEFAAMINIAEDHTFERLAVTADADEAILLDQPHDDEYKLPEVLKATTLEAVSDSDGQYYVPLPLNAIIRDIYFSAVKSSSSQRFEFVTEEVLDPEIITKIDEILSNLDLLCSHSDLITDEYPTQQMVTIEARARFAENRSTKCIFVAELLGAMRNLDKHVAILVRPGRMLEILDAVLRYHQFTRQQDPFEYTFGGASGSLKVSLIPTGPCAYQFGPVDLVVAFDSTFTEEPYIKQMRFNPNKEALSPLVHLIINQSVEHIDKVFPKDIESIERKVKIVNCISDILGEVGKLGREYMDPGSAAQAISEFVAAGAHSINWPCLPMPALEADDSTQADSEEPPEISSRNASYTTPIPALGLQQGSKRQFEDENVAMGIETPKRQRLTPVTNEQENENSGAQRSSLPHSSNNVNGPTTTSNLETSLLESMVADLKAQLLKKDESETQVRRLNESLQGQIKDLTSSIATIQPKFQAALNDRSEFEHQGKEAIARAGKLMLNLESRNEEIAKLKTQKEAIIAELTEARAALASSSVPETAELENLKAEIRALNLDKERLEKQKLNMNKDIEYMRNNYQTASASAAESASSVLAMESELETLRVKASENTVKIHEIQRSNETAAYVRMVKQLKLEKEEMGRELEKKSNELAAAMNGRRSARGASQPKSPRLASPSNGGFPAARNLNRVIQRSRGTSPSGGPEFATPSAPRTFTPLGFGEALPNGQSSGYESRFREYRP